MLKSWFKLPLDKKAIEIEIENFERETSVEVKVVVERKVNLAKLKDQNQFDYCHRLFNNFGMNELKGHSLLLYISLQPKYCAIIGDDKIYDELCNEFTNKYVEILTNNLRSNAAKKDLTYAIKQTLIMLKPDFMRFYDVNFTSKIDNEVVVNEN